MNNNLHGRFGAGMSLSGLDVLRSAERLNAAEVQSVFALQLDHFVTGCDVSEKNSITLDVPGPVPHVVHGDKRLGLPISAGTAIMLRA